MTSQRKGPPAVEPIGVQLTRTAKVLNRAFEDTLAAVGGSLPVWLILVSLKAEHHDTQRALADALGIEGPTLTHHLNKMEAGGLVTRRRDLENRRVQVVELTAAGDATFFRLLTTVTAFDARVREGFSDREVASLARLLTRLRTNAATETNEASS
jgi:MarR family transcriptional regulator, transcriptional regulator for hemolysin